MFEPYSQRTQNLKKPMTQHKNQHKVLDSIDSCTFQLHSWRPFQLQPSATSDSSKNTFQTKRPCLSDRATSFSIDMSRLSLFDDNDKDRDRPSSLRIIARKRRRRGSRSVSGRSSDRSRRCCSVGASAACSDFPVAVGTDSSGELFGNGDANWASDVSEAKNSRRDKEGGGGGSGEKESVGGGFGHGGGVDALGNESGYGSEPGYRGDAEIGYGDEFDEEEDDSRPMFWGDQFGGGNSKMEMVGENTFSDQKGHYRYRRKKNDCRMVDAMK